MDEQLGEVVDGSARVVGSGTRVASKGGVGTSYSGGGNGGRFTEDGSGSMICQSNVCLGFKEHSWGWSNSGNRPAWLWRWCRNGGGLLVVYSNTLSGTGTFESNGDFWEGYTTGAGYHGYVCSGNRYY